MTIVYYDPSADVIGVDSFVSFQSGRQGYLSSKVIRDIGGAIALSGYIIPVEHVSAVVLDEFHKHSLGWDGEASIKWPRVFDLGQQSFSDDVEVAGYARTFDGQVYWVSLSKNRITAIRVDKATGVPAFAEGAGFEWFDAYLAMGKTPHEAACLVAKLHQQCGGEIETF